MNSLHMVIHRFRGAPVDNLLGVSLMCRHALSTTQPLVEKNLSVPCASVGGTTQQEGAPASRQKKFGRPSNEHKENV